MSTTAFRLVPVVAAVALAGVLSAQTGPTPEELTLRPGDTVTWTPAGPHRLRFGGTVSHNSQPLELTKYDDVKKVLDLSPAPASVDQGVAKWPAATKVTGKVRADAASTGVREFFFTCGFDPHANMMVTVSFTIAPSNNTAPRMVEIASANPPKWVLKTASGDKDLKRP